MGTKREIRKAHAIEKLEEARMKVQADMGHTYISKDRDNCRGIYWFPDTPMFDTHEKRIAYKVQDGYPNFDEVMMYIGRYHRNLYAKEAEQYIFYNNPKNRGVVVAMQVGIV